MEVPVHYDVEAVRAHFPALKEGAAHFDGPGGSQVPDVVAQAVADMLCSAVANRGVVTAAERRAEEAVMAGRQAVADLLAADPRGIIFGRSMTQLTMDMARTISATWRPGDEVIVTRLDHDANIRPWVIAAERAGAVVRWAEFDRMTGELPTSAITDLLGERTRLVAVTAASNLLGTMPDVAAITAAAHAVGALAYVDGVHYTAHELVDMGALGADFFACSPYKFLGPHHGVLAGRPELLEGLHPDKLLPSTNDVPERFELGTLPYELIVGTTAAIDFLAHLAPGEGTRRERLAASFHALEGHERQLRKRMVSGLSQISGVTLHGSAPRRTPTVLFSLAGMTPQAVYEGLAQRGVNAPAGSFYAIECARWMGLGEAGAVRAGIAPYTNEDDIDRLVDGMAELAQLA